MHNMSFFHTHQQVRDGTCGYTTQIGVDAQCCCCVDACGAQDLRRLESAGGPRD